MLKYNAYETSLYDFVENIFVICPVCSNQGLVTAKGIKNKSEIKFICTSCGHNKFYKEDQRFMGYSYGSDSIITSNDMIFGGNIDPFFKLQLWLQIDTAYGILWAYNYEHLTFLESHIIAGHRYRNNSDNMNRSIGSRLPKWMKSKKNRENILAIISKLKNR